MVEHAGGVASIARTADPAAPTVVYLHGNGSDLTTVHPLADLLRGQGVTFVAVEYPGYGRMADRPATETGIYDTVDAMLHHLSAAHDICRPVLVGESLGSAVATEMAVRGHGERLVLISAFTSMLAMFRRRAPGYPKLLLRDRFDTLAKIEAVTLPTLLIHGSADVLVPPRMSLQLASRLTQVQRVVVPGRGHSNLWEAPSRTLQLVARHAHAGEPEEVTAD
ncbi:alpha/beta fold hydrolase [Luteipulveratus flavus]|uniref:Alpha/beta fold hydrolase n=1 Tax=Luteipulveratus flavus TaxID=3031728 RepID=A0ABT6C4C6_9MICO|nr:alpha/beta fold hydrolase [Luteipulveratus sp. YIM 133296]MDF8263806.1 alpha/beta fold hydrolase [Luteipulveratus sp. YIM 133296]